MFDSISLDSVPEGARVKILSLMVGRGARQRLLEMGITPGTEVLIVNNKHFGPILVLSRGTIIALGRGIARKILVEVISNEHINQGKKSPT